MSGKLLGGEDDTIDSSSSTSSSSTREKTNKKNQSSGMVDWSYFRGSPKTAMKETIEWIQQRYGSIDGYLDSIDFDERQRQQLRDALLS